MCPFWIILELAKAHTNDKKKGSVACHYCVGMKLLDIVLRRRWSTPGSIKIIQSGACLMHHWGSLSTVSLLGDYISAEGQRNLVICADYILFFYWKYADHASLQKLNLRHVTISSIKTLHNTINNNPLLQQPKFKI